MGLPLDNLSGLGAGELPTAMVHPNRVNMTRRASM
jgi:hypothetical protein